MSCLISVSFIIFDNITIKKLIQLNQIILNKFNPNFLDNYEFKFIFF